MFPFIVYYNFPFLSSLEKNKKTAENTKEKRALSQRHALIFLVIAAPQGRFLSVIREVGKFVKLHRNRFFLAVAQDAKLHTVPLTNLQKQRV